MSNETAMRDGIDAAFSFWLADHPISTPEIMQAAFEKSFSRWLSEHKAELIRAIAEKVHQPRPGGS